MIANNGQEAVNQWMSVERGHYAIAIFDHVSADKDISSLMTVMNMCFCEFHSNQGSVCFQLVVFL